MSSAHRLLCGAAALVAAATLAPAASAATTRHASPAGSGSACTADAPCGIAEAVVNAAAGDDVVVAPGDYAITATLQPPNRVNIHGADGQPRPRLQFSGDQWGLRIPWGSTLRHVEIDQAREYADALHTDNCKVEGIVVRSAGDGATIQSSSIADSVVIVTGPSGRAVVTETNGATNTSDYRNVTAVATGAGGVGIEAWAAGATGNATVTATNVIAAGGPGGAAARAVTTTGAQATLTLAHSSAPAPVADGAGAAVVDGGGNIAGAPAFADAAAGDYRQAPGSPTIDAGLDDALNGAVDLDGDPRVIGTTDIGADEFVPPPAPPATEPGSAPSGDPGVPPAAGPGTTTAGSLFTGVAVRSVRSTGRGRFVLVSLGCPAGTRDSCTGRLAVALRRAGRRPLVLGRAAFAVAAGGRAVVRVRVSRGGRRALARPRRPRLAVTAEARDGAGSSRSTRAVVSLHRAR